uniref:uncharacterized protein LOC109965991 isoform X2 n=1 Tax=Monopterus albus TaxID=43700 RepID=UPI0009B42E13|nr:uncharacterized protein C16orf71 homolog isoform X2 [Monopterus albus]
MDSDPSSCWNSVLEKVKPHIPTMDFTSSANENEEFVTIYQRPAGLSLQLPEDTDSRSVEDAELEELLEPAAKTCCSEKTCRQSVKLDDDDEIVESITATQWGKQHGDNAAEDVCEGNSLEVNRARLNASVKSTVDSTESYQGFPVLSFARLEQWDLDNVLQTLKKDSLLLLHHHGSAELVNTHENSGKDRAQENIMERLAAFCKSQSPKPVSEPGKSPNHNRQNNVWTKPLERTAAESELTHTECPTVFIDLRCRSPSLKPPRTSPNLSSDSSSPAKQNTHQEVPSVKKSNHKMHSGSRLEDREVTGKSMLLQKIREMKRNENKYLSKCTHHPDSVELKEKPPSAVDSTCSLESQHLWEAKQSLAVQSRKPKTRSTPAVQQRSVKDPTTQQSGQQRPQPEQTLQHEEHQKILKQLELHCPTKSVYQKQQAAERTDILYDSEASHLQSVSTLPEDVKREGCILLTVSLSSPGMIGDRAPGKRKHLYPAATNSHIYNTLVAWCLSLVGPDPQHDKDEDSAKVPFWVAGLQQMWTEDGLALHVLAVARRCYTTRKRDRDVRAPFYNHICRFLSETSLAQIAHWLPELNILLDQRAFASPIHLPSSSLSYFISVTSSKKVIERTFGVSPGFYWQTVETQEHVCKWSETTQNLHTEASFALGCSSFFLHPLITHYTFQLVIELGLDVCGLRLLYPSQSFLSHSAGGLPVIQTVEETCQPVLVLAVRGPHAHSVLKDLTSTLHPLVYKITDHTPVSPLHCKERPVFYSPPLASQVHRELCLWFSGRFQGGSAQNHNHPLNRVVTSGHGVRGSLFKLSSSPALLCATTKADILLVVSPVVPPCCYSQVLAVCERRGFSLRGLQRLQLRSNGAAILGLTGQQAHVFCSPSAETLDQEKLELPSRCLVLILRKENAVHHSVSLPAALMREFKVARLLGCISSRGNGVQTLEPSFCFHTVPYSSKLYHTFVRRMWTVPDPSGVILSHQQCPANSNMEQVVILTLCWKDMSQGLNLLHRLLTEAPEGDVGHAGFELLGLKWLPVLTRLQAQELSPYEVGEQLFHNSLDSLMSSPALVCALRWTDAFPTLKKLLPHDYPDNLSVLMSPTPEVAFRQASLFFEHNIILDWSIRTFLPQNCSKKDPEMLLTVCLFKPRVWNHALDKIFHKLQQSGLMVVGMRVVTLDKSDTTSLLSSESDPSEVEAHVECLCSGSSLALCLQGLNAVKRLLDMLDQEDSSLWMDCYGSGSYQKATVDVKKLFPDGLCCTETSTMRQEQILSLCSDPLASKEREQTCTLAPMAQEGLTPSVGSGANGGFLIHGALWQTTCLLIPLNAPPLSQVPAQLELLGKLLRSGCHLVAGRMSILDNKQRKHIADIVRVSSSGDERMTHLYMAPCLIIALQGDKIVTGFNLTLKRIYRERSDLEKAEKMIIYPESEKQAKQLICYLFNALSPEGCHAIVP